MGVPILPETKTTGLVLVLNLNRSLIDLFDDSEKDSGVSQSNNRKFAGALPSLAAS